MISFLIFLIVLTVLVLIHEAGHYFTAKKFGIKVEEFGFGLPPRAFGFKKGETIYSINWLPIGGFVRLYGEDAEQDKDKARSFMNRPAWQRALVVVAGVIMNFVLAVVIISFIFTQGTYVQTDQLRVSEVSVGSPAAIAGLQKDDVIVEADGKPIHESKDLIAITNEKKGKMVFLKIQRGNETVDVTVTPRTEYPKNEGPMGIAISNLELKKYPIWQAPFYGTIEAVKTSWLTISGLIGMLWQWITSGQAPEGVSGPVGVEQLTGEAVKVGPTAVIALAGFLSLNLAVFNILPIPALDGGRFFFIIFEMITGRRVNQKYEQYAHMIGMVLLISLILLISIRDVMRLLSGQPLLPTQ